MCSMVPGATESNLRDPTLGRAFGRVIKNGPLIKVEKDYLDDVLSFSAVIEDAQSNSENQPGIPGEEQIQSLIILGLEAGHEFFIAWEANLNRLRRLDRVLLARPPYDGECQRAPIKRRTHFQPARFAGHDLDRCPLNCASTQSPASVSRSIHQITNVIPAVFDSPVKLRGDWYRFAMSAV